MKYLETLNMAATYYDSIGLWKMAEFFRGLILKELKSRKALQPK